MSIEVRTSDYPQDGSEVPPRLRDLSLRVHWIRSLPAVQRPNPTKRKEYKVWSAKKLFLTYEWLVVNFVIADRYIRGFGGIRQVVIAVNVQRRIRRRVEGKRSVIFGAFDTVHETSLPLTRGEVLVGSVQSFELKESIELSACWQDPRVETVQHLRTQAASVGEQVQAGITMWRRLHGNSPFENGVHEDRLVNLVMAVLR